LDHWTENVAITQNKGVSMDSYTTAQVARRLRDEVPTCRLRWWIRDGLVTPDVAHGGGKGSPILFSERNVLEFAMLRILLEQCGLPLASIRTILNGLRTFPDFYRNAAWGRDQEIIYLEGKDQSRSKFLLKKNDSPLSIDKEDLCVTLTMLGKLKNKAKASLGVN
jgi:DNA-binding transcriptional MerR regulator